MEKNVNLLKHYYNSFNVQTNAWTFIVGLADYVNFVSENKVCKNILLKLSEENSQKLEQAENRIQKIWKQLEIVRLLIHNKNSNSSYSENKQDNALLKTIEADLRVLERAGNGLPTNSHLHNNSLPHYQIIIEKYKRHALEIHNYLINKLLQPIEIPKLLSFNERNGVLKFSNKNITISKTGNTRPHYLLRTIFKDRAKLWNYDEIADDLNDEYDKNSWNKYYQAGYAINEKIAKETGKKDFLKITSKDVSINKNYL